MEAEQRMTQKVDKKLFAVSVRITDDGLGWTTRKDGVTETNRLRYSQILGSDVSEQTNPRSLCVYYVKVVVNHDKTVLLRHDTLLFMADDVVTEGLCDDINRRVQDTQSHRPRRVLVFINPKSGSQDSHALYTQTVKPLFDMAAVTADTIVTTDEHHPLKVFRSYDLSTIDAVLSMGGDGSYGHVFNALMQKSMMDAGLDMDDETVEPVKPPVAFAALPTGSGCVVARTANSGYDLETAAISVILGRKLASDVTVIRNRGSFVRYCLFLGGAGTFIRAIEFVDKLRSLKKFRYWFIFPAIWWLFRTYKVEVQYLEVPESQREFKYPVVLNPPSDNSSCSTVDGPISGWKTFRGNISSMFFMPSYMFRYFQWIMSMPHIRPRLTSGNIRLILDKNQSFWQAILKNLAAKNVSIDENPRDFVPRESAEQVEVSEMKMRVSSEGAADAVLNIGGESCHISDFHAKIYRQKYDMLVIDHDLVSEAMTFENASYVS